MRESDSPPVPVVSKELRRLKKNEMVHHGDFIKADSQEFKPWEGANGFRAGSFVKPVYRRRAPLPAIINKKP